MNEPTFLKRPTAEETDEDLLKMQDEWNLKKREKPTVQIHKMKRKSGAEKTKESSEASPYRDLTGRFTIDIDELSNATENKQPTAQNIMSPIQERWTTLKTEEEVLKIGEEAQQYSTNDGFPEPLNLKCYYSEDEGLIRRKAKEGLSFFASEFDRIKGDLDENLDEVVDEIENKDIEEEEANDFKKENLKYLQKLSADQIADFQKEMLARFDQKTLEFLKNRQKKEEKPKKISKFKAKRIEAATAAATTSSAATSTSLKGETNVEINVTKKKENNVVIGEMLNELEVLDDFSNREDMEKYNRLATDAVQLDLTAKFGRNVVNRQQKNVIRLFDSCKFTPQGYDGKDELREYGRSQIDEIKKLYLEEVDIDGSRRFEFGKGVNPILDNCWTLIPARRVMDAVEKRKGEVLNDDVEIVRLSLLWTLILMEERKTAFYAFAQPADVYVYLSEVLMIGPEILQDDRIIQCVERVLNSFVLKAAIDKKLSIRMDAKIGGLDAFMPFFESLLVRFDEYSMGDVQFARTILIGAYLNSAISDNIEYRFLLWKKEVIVRQMTIKKEQGNDILKAFKKQLKENQKIFNEQYFEQYFPLLEAYYRQISERKILHDRNELVWEIGCYELNEFVKTIESSSKIETKQQKKAAILAEMVRKLLKQENYC